MWENVDQTNSSRMKKQKKKVSKQFLSIIIKVNINHTFFLSADMWISLFSNIWIKFYLWLFVLYHRLAAKHMEDRRKDHIKYLHVEFKNQIITAAMKIDHDIFILIRHNCFALPKTEKVVKNLLIFFLAFGFPFSLVILFFFYNSLCPTEKWLKCAQHCFCTFQSNRNLG